MVYSLAAASKAAILCTFLAMPNIVLSQGVERPIQFVNESGKRIEIHWIHPDTGQMVLQSSPFVFNGATFNLNSYVGHTFQLRELPGKKSGVCGDAGEEMTCRTDMVTVSENDEQVVLIKKGVVAIHQDDKTRARDTAGELMTYCRESAKTNLQGSNLTGEATTKVLDEMAECIEESVAKKLAEANEEVVFQAKIRKEIAEKWENYTCADLEVESSKPKEKSVWVNRNEYRRYNVGKFLDRDEAKIHVIENFITAEECEAMESAAEPRLHRASVADESGGSKFSEARKAMQAGIKVRWELEHKSDPIAVLSRRVYDYTNYATGYGLEEFGQEDLMSIQYFGRNYESGEEPDRYTPHCDGDCNGLKHKDGGRVATMVMYCKIPDEGGATQFRNSGIHIKPKFGMATFFSYMGSDGMMDTGFTEHSGCPVTKGDKKIVTQWMRYGVDKDNHWTSWNTMGVKHSEAYND